jgi:hypothetical protein
MINNEIEYICVISKDNKEYYMDIKVAMHCKYFAN